MALKAVPFAVDQRCQLPLESLAAEPVGGETDLLRVETVGDRLESLDRECERNLVGN